MKKIIAGRKSVCRALMAGILVLGISGCLDKEGVYNPEKKDDGKTTLDNYFDFATTQTVTLNVDYGTDCPKAYFEVYAEAPLIYEEEGGQVTKRDDIIHIAGGFTDSKGKYSATVTLPAAVTEVYIYSPDFGVPQLYKTAVTDKTINAVISFENQFDVTTLGVDGRAVNSRAVTANDIKATIPNVLGGWNSTGKPDYLDSGLKITIDSKLKSYITKWFPEGKKNENSPYISQDADILIKEHAKVWINYFGGETSAQSIFAYYCYQDGATTEQIKQAVKNACVIFPNAHSDGLGKYSGVGVYLRYIDGDGALHNVDEGFPEGTRIGVMIWNQRFKRNNSTAIYYSTKSLNSDGRSHTAVFGAASSSGAKYNVITMEDWTDTDYNDVAFIISSNPIRAIEIPDAPDPGDDRIGTNEYRGLLAFEDNWPSQGDYDMNDVVIKYHSEISYNTSNQILGITDRFILTWTGAAKSNGFSYQLPFDLSLLQDLSGAKSTSGGRVINVFDNARAELGVSGISAGDMPAHAGEIQEKTFTISMVFSQPYAYGVVPPYNPFIRTGSTEIHLPNNAPSAGASNTFPNEADISDGKSTFFICEDGFPFAFHMDARADGSMMDIDLTPERVRIDKTYPGFATWTKTRDPQVKWW